MSPFLFLQAVALEGKTFKRGVSEVPEKIQYHPFFLKMVEKGLIVDAPKGAKTEPENQQARAKKLYDRLMAKKSGTPLPKEADAKVETEAKAPEEKDEEKKPGKPKNK